MGATLLSAYAQAELAPQIRVRPVHGLPVPAVPVSLLPAPFGGSAPNGGDFFPAAPTTLVDNTTYAGYYFPVSNITFDDANIPNSLDTDGDNTYFITQVDVSFYVPATAQQPVVISLYLAPSDASGGVDTGVMLAVEDISLGNLDPGTYVVSLTFPRCAPHSVSTFEFTGTDGNQYDRFWIGVKFPQYCAPLYEGGGPGWWLASGPGYEGDTFYWEGDTRCNGSYGAGYYWFNGNPRASFYMKVRGAATEADAIVTSADVDGNGCVDDADLLAVLFAFGNTGSGLAEDTNCDGIVDDADLLTVLFQFGQGC